MPDRHLSEAPPTGATPTRLRSKPRRIEAYQWHGERGLPSPFNSPRVRRYEEGLVDSPRPYLRIYKGRGDVVLAFPGDYITHEEGGGFSAFSPDEIAEKWEPVVEAAHVSIDGELPDAPVVPSGERPDGN